MKELNNRIGGLVALLSFCLIFGGNAISVCGQSNLTLIFDGRPTGETASAVTKAEEQFIEKEVRRKESVIKAKSALECDDEEDSFGVNGAASGSFTKPNASQKAYLYELCRSGRSFGIGGIVIVENGKVVSHYTYGENGLDSGIAALPDINQNGLSEILLDAVGMGQGYVSGAIEIVELTPSGVQSFGFADVYSDNYGTVDENMSATAYRISAQAGKTPIFFRETYTQKGEDASWTLTKKSQKFSLRKDVSKYNKIL